MPAEASDLKFFLSGGQDNTDPNLSLGGPISSVLIEDPLQVFDEIHYSESWVGDTEWRCVYVKNTHPTATMRDLVAWVIQGRLYDEQGNDIGSSPEEINVQWDSAGVGDGVSTGVAYQTTDEDLPPKLKAPEGVTATPTTGGTLAAGTYYYVVTALNANGETVASQEVAATVDGSATTAVQISWQVLRGATKYRVYGRTQGSQGQYWETTATSFTDTGDAGTAGSPPAANTADLEFPDPPPSDDLSAVGNFDLGPGQVAALWIKRTCPPQVGVSGTSKPKIRLLFGT